jgi:putative flippase GtrA
LPLVVSEAGIARDYFGDEGALICKPNDIQAFYLSLDRVFSNSQFRTDLSVKGKGLAQSKVTKWSDYLGFYQKDIERVVRMKVSSAFWVRLSVLIKKIIDANKMIRFVIAGGTVAITQIGVLYVLTETFGLWYLASSVCSFIYAIIASFYLQKYWAFRDTQKSRAFGQFLQFVGVAILGGLINTASMYFFVNVGHGYFLSGTK